MRGLRRLAAVLAALVLLLVLAPDCLAAEDYGWLGLDELERSLPEEAREVLGGGSVSGDLDVSGALGRVAETALNALGGILRSALAGGLAVLAAVFLCALAGQLGPEGSKGIDYVNLVGVLVIVTACAGGVDSLLGEARECVRELTDFGAMLLPVMASAAAAGGQAASGAAKYAASCLFLDALMALGQGVILPMITMYLAASTAEAAFGGGAGGVAKLLSKAVTRLLTLMVMAFTVYLTATGLIASSADAAAVKAAKTAISALVPVVGGMVSDAAEAVASGVQVIRAAAGALGVAAVLAICVLPVLRLAAGAVVYRAAAMLAESLAPPRLTGLIEAVGTAYSLALGLAGTHAVMLLISIVSAAMAVGG